MLELTKHIKMIHCVCEQYQLKKCLADPTFHQLMEIVKKPISEDTQIELTQMNTSEKVPSVCVCVVVVVVPTSSHCLF